MITTFLILTTCGAIYLLGEWLWSEFWRDEPADASTF